MASALELSKGVPVISLSAVERYLAVAQVLLDHEDLRQKPLAQHLEEEISACRRLVRQVTRQLGLRLRSRDINRFLRQDVGEAAQALRSLDPEILAGYGRLSTAAAASLQQWLGGMLELMDSLQSLAYAEHEGPLSLSPTREWGLGAIALSGDQALFVGGVVELVRFHLASARAWLQVAAFDLSSTMVQSYSAEASKDIEALCCQADTQLLQLLTALHLPDPPSPWMQAFSQRLLDAYNAASAVFESACATWPGGSGAPAGLVPALAALVTTLKDLHRQSLPG